MPASRSPGPNRQYHRPGATCGERNSGTRRRSRSPRGTSEGERYRQREQRSGHDGRRGGGVREDSRGVKSDERLPKRRRVDDLEGVRSASPGDGERDAGRRHRHGRHHHHAHHHRHRDVRRDDGHRDNHNTTARDSAARDSKKEGRKTTDLPFEARQLSRSDLAAFRPLLAYYLDLQKQLDMTELEETEVRGRWKSFMGKWNRGELAEGWYDPEIFQRAAADYEGMPVPTTTTTTKARPTMGSRDFSQAEQLLAKLRRDGQQDAQGGGPGDETGDNDNDNNDDDDDDDYGPPLPGQEHLPRTSTTVITPSTRAPGPSIPTHADLELHDESLAADRADALATHRLARRAHRQEQKALLEESLPPRADAGTRERRLEKRRELNEKLRGFRDRSPGGGAAEVGDAELMGGGGGEGGGGGGGESLEDYKAMLKQKEEKKAERVSRREAEDRARRAEREERVRGYREKEEKVVEALKELARARFGVP